MIIKTLLILISKKTSGNKGFASMVEVMISAVIFVLATVGIMTTISSLKPQQEVSSKKLKAAYLAKGVLDRLRANVDAESWYNPNRNLDPLQIGGPWPLSRINVTLPPGFTSSGYTVTQDPTSPDLRQVTVQISW